MTLIGGIGAAAWAYITYTDTKEKEFYTTYWNKKLEFFIDTSKAASTMATTTSIDAFRTARSDYWELFYGRLSLVEGDAVKAAMQTFAPLVPTNDMPTLPVTSLQQPAYRLTIQLKMELEKAWRKPFSELHTGN